MAGVARMKGQLDQEQDLAHSNLMGKGNPTAGFLFRHRSREFQKGEKSDGKVYAQGILTHIGSGRGWGFDN
jgi:hypothetical protein